MWRGTATVPQGAPPGEWEYIGTLIDTQTNSTSFGQNYRPENIPAGSPGRLTVTGPPADVSPPVLAAFDYSPRSVDVTSGPATVTITAHVKDETGVQYVFLYFRNTVNGQSRDSSQARLR